ncbi:MULTISPECIES: L-threonylcarbamoyladenylate synthase [unclassified Streptococcus]|uniref:L-threonylcarbamoyladenylate synthase n=1 Tax=unclassified Streptococcus TaxID=2608887 RepID=UPI0018ABDBA3|nr:MULTISPECIES: L-threonylcarbamoyladenylate synthase [unclassified Streptococcus]MBF8969452.1 threonylcarbamoyl-AMP synthase [Streptococcus sp. NLN76]MBG9366598.1 threonylcarbamoyl-AMP synthase [Streptococcus sp. NLN64]
MEILKDELEAGRAVILPTETVYGLFAKALNQEAVDLVYALKQRPRDKAMNLNIATIDPVKLYAREIPPYFEELAKHFWPGPLTILLKASDAVPFWINSGLPSVGFRMPAHPLTLELIQKEGPLIGPSANLSGQESGQVFEQIQEEIPVPGYADDPFLTGVDSTILDLSQDQACILRQGVITKEDLKAVVPQLEFKEVEK